MDTTAVPSQLLDSIHLGDCATLLESLPGNCIDLIVSSPPYNIGKSYETKRALEDYVASQMLILRECSRVMKPGGSMFWQVGSYAERGVHIPLDVRFFPILESLGLTPRNRIVWLRTHGLHATRRFSCRHETLLWFTKGDDYKFFLDPIRVPQKYPNKTSWRGHNKGELTSNPLGKNPGDVWVFRNVKHNHEEQTIHPCQFPEDLVQRTVLATTQPGEVVMDPYAGVGTVPVVARDLGRHFVAAEMSQEYHAVALHRLSGEPDEKGNFPNLKTLRRYAELHGVSDLSRFTFTMQVGKVPTDAERSRIFPEHEHLERFMTESETEAANSAFARGLVDASGERLATPTRKRRHQLSMWKDKD